MAIVVFSKQISNPTTAFNNTLALKIAWKFPSNVSWIQNGQKACIKLPSPYVLSATFIKVVQSTNEAIFLYKMLVYRAMRKN